MNFLFFYRRNTRTNRNIGNVNINYLMSNSANNKSTISTKNREMALKTRFGLNSILRARYLHTFLLRGSISGLVGTTGSSFITSNMNRLLATKRKFYTSKATKISNILYISNDVSLIGNRTFLYRFLQIGPSTCNMTTTGSRSISCTLRTLS